MRTLLDKLLGVQLIEVLLAHHARSSGLDTQHCAGGAVISGDDKISSRPAWDR